MKFEEILPLMRKGAKAARESWNRSALIFIDGDVIMRRELQIPRIWSIPHPTLLADDWYIVEEQ